MDTDIIDLIYQNEEVEGIAVFATNGEVIENQLALTEESVKTVSQHVADIAAGLDAAGRTLRGFILKSDSITYQICVFDHVILLLHLTGDYSANKVELSVRSIIGEVFNTPETAQPEPINTVSSGISQLPPIEKQQSLQPETVQDVVAEPTEDQMGFADFKLQLSKLIKRVAPSGVADKMINDTLTEASIDPSSINIGKETAIELGNKVVAKIPNASRRKMIAKEFKMLSTKF